jgi:hypothetical protein
MVSKERTRLSNEEDGKSESRGGSKWKEEVKDAGWDFTVKRVRRIRSECA